MRWWKWLWQKIKPKQDTAPPPEPPVDILKSMGQEYDRAITSYATTIVRQLHASAQQGDVTDYIPYMFHLIMDQPNGWPTLKPFQMRALTLCRTILRDSGQVPRSQIYIPPGDAEDGIDIAIVHYAQWCSSTMLLHYLKEFQNLQKKYTPRVRSSLGDRLRPDAERSFMWLGVRRVAQDQPTWFTNPGLIERVLEILQKFARG